jgi:hypothetical protein
MDQVGIAGAEFYDVLLAAALLDVRLDGFSTERGQTGRGAVHSQWERVAIGILTQSRQRHYQRRFFWKRWRK